MTTKAEIIEIIIPTYQRGGDSPYPPLKFGRKQGFYNQYPYCLQDDIDIGPGGLKFVPEMKYTAVKLSNGVLEAIVLPGMNGRLFSLKNIKTGREIFYRNNVVKPGLVAIRGAWISGGIEFNAPSLGHSVSTVAPVFYYIENGTGECAVTIGDIDRCTRQSWQVRMSLKSGRAALDITTTISNPNNYRERLYYWENAAVPVSDDLRFLCNARWTTGATLKPWPMQGGVDKSRHINNLLPCDHFSYRQDRDVFGAFYEKSRLGTYHLAFRHETSGQKYFTWGQREDCKIWEKFLTDADGQYIEIQSGLFQSQAITDWLGAGESVCFQGSWFGTENLGPVTWADKNIAIALSEQGGTPTLDIFSIGLSGRFRVSVISGAPGKLREEFIQLTPTAVRSLKLPALKPTQDFELQITTSDGRMLFSERHLGEREKVGEISPRDWVMESEKKCSWNSVELLEKNHFWGDALNQLQKKEKEIPAERFHQIAASIFLKTNQLDATGVAISKGLAVDPSHAELHTLAMAFHLRCYYLRRENRDLWHLQDHCLALRANGKLPVPAIINLAIAELLKGNELYAGEILASAPGGLTGNTEALTLLAGIRRRSGDGERFRQCINNISELWLYRAGEEYLFTGDTKFLKRTIPEFKQKTDAITFVELLIEWLLLYWRSEWFDDLLKLAKGMARLFPNTKAHPIFNLLWADAYARVGNTDKARQLVRQATTCSLEFVFPYRWEEKELLQRGQKLLRSEDLTFVYLQGLLLIENARIEQGIQKLKKVCDGQVDDSVKKVALTIVANWEGMVGSKKQEVKLLRKAFEIGEFDRRLFIQLDSELRRAHAIVARKKFHRSIPVSLKDRGDITLRRALWLFDNNKVEQCLAMLRSHRFNQFEGEALVRRLYVDCLLILGLRHFGEDDFDGSSAYFNAVREYPENLGAASYLGEHSRLARFMLGLVAEKRGDNKTAKKLWAGVLQQSDYEAYIVGGAVRIGVMRPEELAARALAAGKLKRLQRVRSISEELISQANLNGATDVVESAECCKLMLDGTHQKAIARIRKAAIVMPCSGLIRIIELLVKLAGSGKI